MSTYNGEEYLRTQLNSILKQKTGALVDIFVRDDGSTDGTVEILKEAGINYYQGKNLGPAKSFFELLQNTEGYDYYAFADQDDYWCPNKLEAGMERLQKYSGIPALVFSNPYIGDEKLHRTGKKVYRKAPDVSLSTVGVCGNIIGCSVMINEKLAGIIRNHRSPECIRMHDFYLAVITAALGGRIIFDSRAYMIYRQHSSNTEGVPIGVLNTLRNRYKEITKKQSVSISGQAAEILREYGELFPKKNRVVLKKIATYDRSFFSRAGLALSLKTRYISINMSVTNRLGLLLGNR